MSHDRVSRHVSTAMMMLLFFGCLFFHASSPCFAKEVEVTKEWTLLGENDTIPAGMHIRMDLSTGEKWVKLIDDNDNNDNDEVATDSVQISSSGGIQSVSSSSVAVSSSSSSSLDNQEDGADYVMMHRTLSKLPPEEHERIGGLPELPETVQGGRIDPKQRAAFESRMKQIWEQRQADLKEFQDEFLADLPKLLNQRILRLKSYLANPHLHLTEMNLDKEEDSDTTNNNKNPGDDDDDAAVVDDDTVTHIVSVLKDLEYHLSDVDMTRDFHTLGGWPLLVALLSNSVHQSTNHTTLTPDLVRNVNTIQTNAAWAIGTAVKNTEEFFPYAVEKIFVGTEVVTALSLLLEQFQKDNDDALETTVAMKRHKVMYAMGSLLRGNRIAQIHFVELDGPAILKQGLREYCEESSVDAKLAMRILSLADDIVSDVVLHASSSQVKSDTEMEIIQAFSDEEWCQYAVQLVQQTRFVDAALRTIRTMAPYCQWDRDAVENSIHQNVKATLLSNTNDMDPEHWKERMELVESTLEAVRVSN